MAFTIRNAVIGSQPIATTDTVQNLPLGTIVVADDPTYFAGEFIYMKGVASTVLGSWVNYNYDDCSTVLLVAGSTGPVGIAMSINVASQFGWYQISGKGVGKALAGYADNGLVYSTSTGGSIDDAVVSGDRIKLALGASAVGTPSSGLAEFEISRPFSDDGAAT